MAKVTGPLMSLTASGTVGGTITFDKRGFVRQRVIPANPQTGPQGNVRQMLLAVQKVLKVLHATTVLAVSALAPTSYRWNSYLVAQTIGPGSADFDASETVWLALAPSDRVSWDAEAAAVGVVERSSAYATDPPISGGLATFAVARALFAVGLNQADGAPGAANFVAWKNYIYVGT